MESIAIFAHFVLRKKEEYSVYLYFFLSILWLSVAVHGLIFEGWSKVSNFVEV